MSGRRRELSLEFVLPRTQVVLRVDFTSRTKETVSEAVPIHGESRTFPFEFCRQQIQPLEVLWTQSADPVDLTQPVRFVSEAVIRSKDYQERVHRDGARKIMYYDECPAFDASIDGDEALLLLRGHDPDLGAHRAVMGDGLLALSFLEQVLKALASET